MRILMVAARCPPLMGGIETHIREVGPRLVARGHSVDVLSTDAVGDLPAREDLDGMRIRRLPAWPKGGDLYLAPGIHGAIRSGIVQDAWDVIHFQGYATFVVPIGLAAAMSGAIPFVMTFHSGGHSSRLRNAVRGAQRAVLRPMVSRAARLIGVSRFEADFFSAKMGVPRDRFVVIPNGAAMPVPSPGVEVDPHLIVSSGRLERYKGHHRAIAAMPHLLRRVPQARLHIAGTGPHEAELRAQASALGLDGRVTIGAIPGADRQKMADLLAGAGLFVLFSDYEAHPVAVMEALALGRPVLVSDTSGLGEIAADGLCRAIPPDAGPQETAAAMANELEAERAGSRPLRDLKLPDWDACTQALCEVYKDVLLERMALDPPDPEPALLRARAGRR